MKLKDIYYTVIKQGIEADPRGKKEIESLLKNAQEEYRKLPENRKEFFDKDRFFNPFADTRILNGKDTDNIRTAIVGIDVGGEELLLVDKLRESGIKIDLVIAHHPMGKAYASFYNVMDLQVDIFVQQGINVALAEGLLHERKSEVSRKVGAANHQRYVDVARWLNINLLCMHTPADNLAYRYIERLMKKERPRHLGQVLDILFTVPEYRYAASMNNPPRIFVGREKSRVSKIHIEFTGGTEGPKDIYQRLSHAGVDTIIAMHQSEEHFKRCKEANINVVVASHIASDTLGMNLMLDYIEAKGRIKIYEFSGFRRFSHKKK